MPENRTQNEILNHASGVTIHGGTFSNVGRDQYNYTIVHAQQKNVIKTRKHLPGLSQFTEVKCGDIYRDPSGVCYSWRLCSNGKDDTEAAVYHAELNIVGPFGQKRFTVKTYRGRNAMKEWRQDFLRCSGDWCREIPLFGYNTSSVPLLIFYGELVPLADIQYETVVSENLMTVYFDILKDTLGCFLNEIWMDPKNGKFCRGPAGPKCWDLLGDQSGISVPADVDFLKEGVLIRYLINNKHDEGLLWALSRCSDYRRAKNSPSVYPKVISSSRNTTITSRQDVGWVSTEGSLVEGIKGIRSGLTRFRLKNDQRNLHLRSGFPSQSWLAHALSVFHAHGISLDEDLSQYKLVYTIFILEGTLEGSRFKQQLCKLSNPIYFFLESCPSSPTSFYFWSRDPTGRNRLSLDMCNHFGLPSKFSLEVIPLQVAWPTKIYKALHDYQISRGFDPRTADFARYIDYPTWEVILPENRFQELDLADENNLPSGSEQMLPELSNTLQHLKGRFSAPLTQLCLKTKTKCKKIVEMCSGIKW